MELSAKHSRLITFAACVVAVTILHLARGVFIPFALAMLASFLLAPLVLRLQRWHIHRVVAVIAVVMLVVVAVVAASWLVLDQVSDVAARVSNYKQNVHERMATLRGAVAGPVQGATDMLMNLGSELLPPAPPSAAGTAIQTVRIAEQVRGPVELLRDSLSPAIDTLMTAAMALLFAIVMLLRRDDLGDRLIRMIGRGKILATTRALEETGKKVSSYLWRLLLINTLHGIAVGVGLSIIGIPNALLWGLIAATLRFIPYVGSWIAAAFPVLTSLAISEGWTQPLLTIALFAVLDLVSNNFLEPWIYGKGTGISPLAILVAALFWTWTWGPVGLLLATPLTVCLVVIGKHVPQLQFLQLLFGDAPGLSPPSRLYQRLIAGDQDQAWLVLRTELEQKPLHEVYDSIVLPALSMAGQDRERGVLDQAAEARIEETMRLLVEDAGEVWTGADVKPESSQSTVPEEGPLRVLCIPARGTTDAIAAIMLRHVLERDRWQVEVLSIEEFTGGNLELLERRRVDVVCISAAPPSRFIHVRHLCKRIAARFPNMPIVAGIWTMELDSPELVDRLSILEGVHTVTSLGEARTRVREVVESSRKLGAEPVVELVAR